MKVAVVGFSGCGRSTLVRAAAGGHVKGSLTAVPVPDPRFDLIVEQVKPKKITPATVIFNDDLDALQPTGRMLSVKAIDEIKKSDLILHVVRGFESNMAPYYAEIDPVRDENKLFEELLISDLQMTETRLEKLQKSMNSRNPGHPEYTEKAMMERIKPILETMKPLRDVEFAEEEQILIRNYQFLTAKPIVVAFNLDEGHAGDPGAELAKHIEDLGKRGTPAFAVCAQLEEEIAQLEPADQEVFLSDMGVAEPAAAKVIRAIYDAMGLITFFTAGENETRAWPLRRGSTALKAAGTIHTDIAKGFIRAEVVSYEDYVAAGSLDAAYHSGKMKLEGKDHLINDGDLIHIRNKS